MNVTLCVNEVFVDVVKLNRVRLGLSLLAGDKRHREERRPCEQGDINCSDTIISQGAPRTARNHQKLRSKEGFFARTFRGSMVLSLEL